MKSQESTWQNNDFGNGVSPGDRECRRADMTRQQKFLVDEGATLELTSIGPKISKSKHWEGNAYGSKATVTGWFPDPEKLADIALKLDEEAKPAGIYVTLNECNPSVSARSYQHLKAGVNRTSKKDIVSLDNLLIDLDPDRPEGVSSTDEEHEAALKLAREIKDDLQREGFPEPMFGDSGNGAHLIYKTARPNTQEEVEFRKRVLTALDKKYSTDKVKVDMGVYDPARITKLYGTNVRKGDDRPDRPHRQARIISVPEHAEPVLYELLKALADTLPEEPKNPKTQATAPVMANEKFDVEKYLTKYDIDIKNIKPHGTATMFVLDECVFNSNHSGGEAAIVQSASGALSYQCFHDSCKAHTWAEARKIISADEKLTGFMPNTPSEEMRQRPEQGIIIAADDNKLRKIILPNPPLFPIDVFPPGIRELLDAVAKSHTVPHEVPCSALLVMAGACIGRTRALEIRHGWREHPNLYLAVVGRSGTGKSPATKSILSPIFRLEEQWGKTYEEELRAWEAEEDKSGDSRPRQRQVIAEDASLEALSEALSDNPRGQLWYRDELKGFFDDLDKYSSKSGGTKSRLMSSYDSGQWKINRISKGRNLYIPRATLSIFGTVQPRTLPDIFSDRDNATGFLPRFLFLRADTDSPPYWTDEVVPKALFDVLNNMVAAFLGYSFSDDEEPQIVRVSPAAKMRYVEWFDQQVAEPWRDLDSMIYEALLAKLRGQCLRLCLILHCLDAFEKGYSEITKVKEVTMMNAIRLANCFKEHQKQVWQFVVNPSGINEIHPLQKRVIRAVLENEDNIRNGMLPTSLITQKVNEGVHEKFHVTSMSVGKAAGSLGFPTKHLPGQTSRGICVTPDDIQRIKPLINTDGSCGLSGPEALPIQRQGEPVNNDEAPEAGHQDEDILIDLVQGIGPGSLNFNAIQDGTASTTSTTSTTSKFPYDGDEDAKGWDFPYSIRFINSCKSIEEIRGWWKTYVRDCLPDIPKLEHDQLLEAKQQRERELKA